MSLPHAVALLAVVVFGLGAGVALHGIARAGEVEREARYTVARGELDRERIAVSDERRAEAHVAATRDRLLELAGRRNAARRARNMGATLCLAALFFGGLALWLVRDSDDLDDLEIAQSEGLLAALAAVAAAGGDDLEPVDPDEVVVEDDAPQERAPRPSAAPEGGDASAEDVS